KNRQTCHPENVENEVANRSFQVVQNLKKKIDSEYPKGHPVCSEIKDFDKRRQVRNDKIKASPAGEEQKIFLLQPREEETIRMRR
ncbi:MAG: hypothetical protein IKO56_02020, partial [Alphaproteobacteria bacterium]|nr:hypothetical protein [Alphaproteobacteria bacterium]